jgi:hypothetical protein
MYCHGQVQRFCNSHAALEVEIDFQIIHDVPAEVYTTQMKSLLGRGP